MDLSICYLCGKSFGPKDIKSADHVPPKQIFPRAFRDSHNLSKLVTLPSHYDCNHSYKFDEDYFVHSIGPMVAESGLPGRALWDDIKRGIRKPKGLLLAEKVYKEFSDRTEAGLILPRGMVVKRFDGQRVWRVVWKIVRGLYFYEFRKVLPEDKPRVFDLYEPGVNPPEVFRHVRDTPPRGVYGQVFDYKYKIVASMNNFNYWALLFWDALIMTVAFHDAECCCEQCQGSDSRLVN